MPAASLERKGFQTRYSVFVAGRSGFGVVLPLVRGVWFAVGVEVSTEMRFSP